MRKKFKVFQLILGKCQQDPDPGPVFKNSDLLDPELAENGPDPQPCPRNTKLMFFELNFLPHLMVLHEETVELLLHVVGPELHQWIHGETTKCLILKPQFTGPYSDTEINAWEQ